MIKVVELTLGYKRNIPLISIIIADLIPLFGVIFYGWDSFSIIFIFWFENLVIGFYNILKMFFAKAKNFMIKIISIPFFTIHYGIFCTVHGFFLFQFFGKESFEKLQKESSEGPFVLIKIIWNAANELSKMLPEELVFALVALIIGHGISFFLNYLERKEYKIISINELMSLPYHRIVIMHFAIILGAFIMMLLGSPIGLLVALILMKIILNIIFHRREHSKLQKLAQAK